MKMSGNASLPDHRLGRVLLAFDLRRLYGRLRRRLFNLTLPAFVIRDKTAYIDPHSSFRWNSGEIIIKAGACVSRDCEILAPATIGERAFLNRGVFIRAHTHIGQDVAVGQFAKLITDVHSIGPSRARAGAFQFHPIVVEDGVWIGADAMILGGVTIGRGSVVAAGAVVTKDVSPNSLVAGVPARHIRNLGEA